MGANPGTQLRRLTLTFDNGPTPGITERVLDVPARHGLQATFFVIGRQLRKALPKVFRELAVITAGLETGATYEMEHHRKDALAAGVRPEQLRQRLELVVTVAWYNCIVRVLLPLEIELEPGLGKV